MDPDIVARLQRIVAGVAGPARTPPDAGPDTPLGEAGYWLDSVELVEVVLAAEQEFEVAFDGEADLTARALASVGTLAELIRDKIPR